MYLDQVQDRALHPLGRAPHLRDARLAAAGPYFGREKHSRSEARFGDEIAGHFLGAAIHWRRVDHPPAVIRELLQHLPERLPRLVIGTDIEHLPGAEPYHWQDLA